MIAIEKVRTFSCDPLFALDPLAAKHMVGRLEDGLTPSVDELISCVHAPNDIKELSGLHAACGDMRIGIVITPTLDVAGLCYSSDEYEILADYGLSALLALNPSLLGGQLSVCDLFLHELAHIFTGELHGWRFLCVLNSLRIRCGLSPSSDPYDGRDGFEGTRLPDTIKADADLLQKWCARIGTALAGSSCSFSSVTGALTECERILDAMDQEAATPEAMLSLSDEICNALDAAPFE